MNAAVPYVFFIYIFILTWIIMMNYDKIKEFTSSERSRISFISVTISLFVFVGVATIYNLESRGENYKEKIKDISLDFSLLTK